MSKKSTTLSTFLGVRIATKHGLTGVIVSEANFPFSLNFTIILDGQETKVSISKDKVYFPKHVDGYNQPFFNLS